MAFNHRRRGLLAGLAGTATYGALFSAKSTPDDQLSKSVASLLEKGEPLPSGVTSIRRPLAPSGGMIVRGVGRERSFVRQLGSDPVYQCNANFVTYQDHTIDRSGGVAGYGIHHRSPNAMREPLEGFKMTRCNVNGHRIGLDLQDIVIGSIEDSYVQACSTGIKLDRTEGVGSTMLALRQLWVRDNSAIGADLVGVTNLTIDQVAFEKCTLGAKLGGCTAVFVTNSWWERNASDAEIINCLSTRWSGGSVDGGGPATRKSSGAQRFYFNNKASPGTHVFDGAWRVESQNSQFFATADTGATIIVRTPDLLSVGWRAVNGGQIIFDLTLFGKQKVEAKKILRTPHNTISIDVPGASLGDICEAWVDLPQSEMPYMLTACCLQAEKVVVTLPESMKEKSALSDFLVMVRVKKTPIIS